MQIWNWEICKMIQSSLLMCNNLCLERTRSPPFGGAGETPCYSTGTSLHVCYSVCQWWWSCVKPLPNYSTLMVVPFSRTSSIVRQWVSLSSTLTHTNTVYLVGLPFSSHVSNSKSVSARRTRIRWQLPLWKLLRRWTGKRLRLAYAKTVGLHIV